MSADELNNQILSCFGLTPTANQAHAIATFSAFMTQSSEHSCMILRGSAGTGKTSVAAAMVRTMVALGHKVVLMAPTGRAAKVFSQSSGMPAYTIHHLIYLQKAMAADGGSFALNYNRHSDTLFLVDESSMIANQGFTDSTFGSGCLLDDLIQFVAAGRNCKLVFIGDMAQLPPVGETQSPALQTDVVAGYGMQVYESTLNEVVRQSQQSGILYNATQIRTMLLSDVLDVLPSVKFVGFADIEPLQGADLIETLSNSYHHVGLEDTIVITRSNKRANIYNQGIRNMVLDREEELSTGDMLMIVKNNYFWLQTGNENKQVQFIANGEMAQVQRVRNERSLYGFRFVDVLLKFPDGLHDEVSATVLLDALNTDAPSLTKEQNEQLFLQVLTDYADLPLKADRMKKLREDRYFNALQVKYAYAVTCHKAQGGQWQHVYVDQGYVTPEMLTPDYLRWLYTAFTRASHKLYLVNWPKEQVDV